jgi:hypothetical protein
MSSPFYDVATIGGAAKKKKHVKKSTKGTTLHWTASGYKRMKTVGTKREVYNGKAHHTAGKLTKSDLMKSKKGKIVSKKQHAAGVKAGKRIGFRKGGYFGRIGDIHKIGLGAFRAGGRATKATKAAPVYEEDYARYGGAAPMDPRYGGAEDYSSFYY